VTLKNLLKTANYGGFFSPHLNAEGNLPMTEEEVLTSISECTFGTRNKFSAKETVS
jgi:hypothetical protein